MSLLEQISLQGVKFTRSKDGTSLAWLASGRGPALVKASNWLTNLEYDADSPVWGHWTRFLENNFNYLRYDEPGCGLSRPRDGSDTLDNWVADLEAVVDAANPPEPFILLGVSQGAATAIAYSVKHPEKVSKLILYGGYARGANKRDDPRHAELYRAVIDIFSFGWGDNNPAFTAAFSSRFIPDGDATQLAWFRQLCENSLDPDTGARLLRARADVDVSDQLAKVHLPTLILHAKEDAVVALDEGRLLGERIAGARSVLFEGKNHILLESEPGWQLFQDSVLGFCGVSAKQASAILTLREQSILDCLLLGQSNKEIGTNLGISEKTVRNCLTRLFAKMGVKNRQQLIVKHTRI